MTDRKFEIIIVADDQFSKVFQKAVQSVLATNKTIEGTRKGLKKIDEDKSLKSISQQLADMGLNAKDAVAGLGALVPAVSTLAAIGTIKGIGTLTAQVIDQNAQMSRTAKIIGMNSTAMQLYMGAAEQVGIPAAVVEQTFGALAQTMQSAEFSRDPAALGVMNTLGITLHKLKNGTIDYDDAFRQLSKTFDRVRAGGGIQAATELMRTVHLDPLVQLLIEGDAGIQKLINKWAQFHGVIREEDLARYERLAQKLRLIQGAAEGAGNALMNQVAPSIELVTDKILRLIAVGQEQPSTSGAVAAVGGKIVGAGQRGLRSTGLVMGTDTKNPELMFDLGPAVDLWNSIWGGMLGGVPPGSAAPSATSRGSPAAQLFRGAAPTGAPGMVQDDDITGTRNRIRGGLDVTVNIRGGAASVVTQPSGDVNVTTNVEGFMPSGGP